LGPKKKKEKKLNKKPTPTPVAEVASLLNGAWFKFNPVFDGDGSTLSTPLSIQCCRIILIR